MFFAISARKQLENNDQGDDDNDSEYEDEEDDDDTDKKMWVKLYWNNSWVDH